MSDFTSPQTVQFPGSTDTEPYGADAAGDVVGTSYGATDVGFVDRNGSYVSIAPSATDSDVNAVSEGGLVVGDVNGKAVTYQIGGSGANPINLSSLSATITFSSASAVSGNGNNIVGYYDDNNNSNVNFADIGGTLSTLVVPGANTGSTYAKAVNNSGEVVGSFDTRVGTASFIEQNGYYTEFEIPNAYTYAEAVNNGGTVAGDYYTTTGEGAFERDASGKITLINVANAQSTSASSINDAGQLAGTFADTNGKTHGYVYDNGAFIQVDIAGNTQTSISNINSEGEITGTSVDANGNLVGFAEKPLPEVKLTSTGSSAPDNSQFTITGTAFSAGQAPEAGQTVTILDNNQSIGTTKVNSDGTFSASVTLPNVGTNTITASVTADGVTGTSSGVNYNLFESVRDLDGTSQEVERLFYTTLKHAADAASLATDVKRLDSGHTTLTRVADGLVGSSEFRSDFGHLSDSAFVQQLFEAATGSAIDTKTLSHDVHALHAGESRGKLAVHIAQSDAAVAHLSVQPV